MIGSINKVVLIVSGIFIIPIFLALGSSLLVLGVVFPLLVIVEHLTGYITIFTENFFDEVFVMRIFHYEPEGITGIIISILFGALLIVIGRLCFRVLSTYWRYVKS